MENCKILKCIFRKIQGYRNKNRITKMVSDFNIQKKQMKHNPILVNSIKNTIKQQRCILEENCIQSFYDISVFSTVCPITIVDDRTLNVAANYKKSKICVLNFACSTDPGGGVERGSMGQEESLCRSSTLFPCLCDKKMFKMFYEPHIRKQQFLSNDDCIYSPNVIVYRTDEMYPKTMKQQDWFKVNVITCSAPALHRTGLCGNSLYEIHLKRLRRILDVAAEDGNEIIILGAFGCGAFRNEPHIVAEAMMNVVKHYRHVFKAIVFAVPNDKRNNGKEASLNYTVFYNAVFNSFNDCPIQ